MPLFFLCFAFFFILFSFLNERNNYPQQWHWRRQTTPAVSMNLFHCTNHVLLNYYYYILSLFPFLFQFLSFSNSFHTHMTLRDIAGTRTIRSPCLCVAVWIIWNTFYWFLYGLFCRSFRSKAPQWRRTQHLMLRARRKRCCRLRPLLVTWMTTTRAVPRPLLGRREPRVMPIWMSMLRPTRRYCASLRALAKAPRWRRTENSMLMPRVPSTRSALRFLHSICSAFVRTAVRYIRTAFCCRRTTCCSQPWLGSGFLLLHYRHNVYVHIPLPSLFVIIS